MAVEGFLLAPLLIDPHLVSLAMSRFVTDAYDVGKYCLRLPFLGSSRKSPANPDSLARDPRHSQENDDRGIELGFPLESAACFWHQICREAKNVEKLGTVRIGVSLWQAERGSPGTAVVAN